jgi:hypothetical protein
MNITGMLYMPLLIWLGVPIMLSSLSAHVSATTPGWQRIKGLAIAFGIVELLQWILFVVLFVAQTKVYYTSYYPRINYSQPCYISSSACQYGYYTYAPISYDEPAFA